MENEIEEIRKEVKRYFDSNNQLPGEKYQLSESGLYYYTSQRYKQSDPKRNWVVCKIELWEIKRNVQLFEYFTDADDSDCGHAWICKNNKEYLLLPEAFQGQSVFDISTNKLYSFYSSAEPFIWRHIYPSPNANKIAVIGCYWGHPNELRVYNTENITTLPYLLYYVEHSYVNENGFQFMHWQEESTVVVYTNAKKQISIKI